MRTILRHLRRAALLPDGQELSDEALLAAFVSKRDEAAFEALLRRHGPMVLSVCQRVLRHAQDAEDAFQATFLVLIRKANALRSRGLLANWLYGVAYRTALKARGLSQKRRARELTLQSRVVAESAGQEPTEALAALDRELTGLPAKYRVPVVLCELQGRSRKEVAQQLDLPEGTLSSRLATARKLLARRLTKRGLALTALGATAPDCLPAHLLASTVYAATATPLAFAPHVVQLTEKVIIAMFLSRLRIVAAVAVIAGVVGSMVVATGAGIAYQKPTTAAQQPGRAQAERPKSPASPTVAEEDVPEAPDAPLPALKSEQVKALLAAAPVSDKMRQLLKDRYDAAELAAKEFWLAATSGRVRLESLFQPMKNLLKAERTLSLRKADQLAAIARHVQRMKRIQAVMEPNFAAGLLAPMDIALARYRADAEIMLERAKLGNLPPPED
jgi:RNA polymerase sigma factor (sigma-70 family)